MILKGSAAITDMTVIAFRKYPTLITILLTLFAEAKQITGKAAPTDVVTIVFRKYPVLDKVLSTLFGIAEADRGSMMDLIAQRTIAIPGAVSGPTFTWGASF